MKELEKQPHFDGDDYQHNRDRFRLSGQIAEIYHLMKDGLWRTLEEISDLTGHPHASISAQLRNLRKARFGGYFVDREHIKDGLYKYRLDVNKKSGAKDKCAIMMDEINPKPTRTTGLEVWDKVLYQNPHLKHTFSIEQIEIIRADLEKAAGV